MRLELRNSYKSIRSLTAVDLPDFTLITGVNGSGKSHLLYAIAGGDVLVDGIQRPVRSGGPLSAAEFLPSAAEFSSYELSANWRPQIPEIATTINQARTSLRETLLKFGFQFSVEELICIIDDPNQLSQNCKEYPDGVMSTVRSEISVHEGHISNTYRNYGHFGAVLANISKITGKGILNLNASDLEAPVWGVIEESNQISTVFVNYRDNWLRNRLRQLRSLDGNDVDYVKLEDFSKRYGEPPWEVVDRVLGQMGLNYMISRPDMYELVPYRPFLISSIDGAHVAFKELSSGERVLLGLALSSYDRWDRRISTVQSSLLLLDELDAPLHPAMARNYISTIVDEIVGRQRVAVIATTHSLATVALAPESAIHILRSNPHRLEKVTKAKALSILSEGVPTLAIDFGGRRQVFCESEYDARAYAAVYDNLRPAIGSERSLDFIAATVSGDAGHIGGGRAVVKSVVKQLTLAHNTSAMGIIDWDGENEPAGRVHVLAKGKRDGLENLLLDPLLLVGLIALRFEKLRNAVGIDPTTSVAELKSFSADRLQQLSNAVQERVLGDGPDRAMTEVAYFGGYKLQVARSYLVMDDHDIGDKVLEVFKFRSIVNNRSGAGAHGFLMEEIGRSVCRELREFVPMDLIESLSGLLDAEL